MCSIVAGVGYPAYASCKALDSGSSSEKSHWLAYWLAFGGISAVEACLAQRFPGYYHLKLLLLLWLQSRRYQGAWRLYIEFIRPVYRKLRPQADASLHQAASVMVRLCVLTPTFASRRACPFIRSRCSSPTNNHSAVQVTGGGSYPACADTHACRAKGRFLSA